MVFSDSDEGPFYLTAEERVKQKYPRHTGEMVTKDKTISELKAELASKNIHAKGVKKKIVELATAAGIDLKKSFEKILPGWVDEPKGMLQVQFERGNIDPKKYDPIAKRDNKVYYTVDGKKDAYGNFIEDSSLRRMTERMPDFVSEETLLQYHAKRIGVAVDHSPKAHPEVAGEGIEYGWGFSKIIYRRHPLEEKKKKEKFRQLVKSVSQEIL